MCSGQVLGVGIDLVENERMQEVLTRWGPSFRNRVFLPGEQEYCEAKSAPHRHYAGRFAVKEAVSKSFGTGFGPGIGLLDIEVVRNPETGAPSVKLSERAQKLAVDKHVGGILVSLSHTRHYAVAEALLLRSEGRRMTEAETDVRSMSK